MRRGIALVAVICMGSCCLADMEVARSAAGEKAEEGAGRRRWQGEAGWGIGMLGSGRFIDRVLINPRVATELGLTEETVNKLREELKELDAKSVDLDARVKKLALDQADQLSRFLQNREAGTNDLMKLTEDIGRQRTEQGKLAIQRLVVIRKYLTPEQIRKARELVHEHMQKEREGRGGAAAGAPGPRANERTEKRANPRPLKAETPGTPPPKPPEGW